MHYRQVLLHTVEEKRSEIADFLKGIPLLFWLSDSERLKLAEALEIVKVDPNKMLLEQGESVSGVLTDFFLE